MAAAGSLAIPSSPLALRYRARAEVRPRREYLRDWGCRAINVAVGVLGVLLASPLMLVIALLIKATSRGPVIYKQPRVGIDRRSGFGWDDTHRRQVDRGGRIFTIYKFRTMYARPKSSEQVWASRNDPRVTTIGRFLRATRLDELPQLFNVLKGDMNVVGPRPEQPGIFSDLRQEFRGYQRRQRVLPGITGLAQVNLGYDTDLENVKRKVELDLEYIRGRSATKDLLIMAKTVPVVVFQKVWM